MESSTTSLPFPRPAGRSRFSKALPAPPSLNEVASRDLQSFLPPRKDSLPSRPSIPLKDKDKDKNITANTIVRKAVPSTAAIPSNMATRMMDTPLPALPSLARVNSPPSVVPKRKPVGSGVSVKSHPSPPPQPLGGGEISPVDSISSLLSAYGEGDSSEARNSVETAATKYSSFEPSPPKVLPKDHLGSGVTKLDLVSPLALPTPLSSNMSADQHVQRGDRPPTPPMKDSKRPTTPKSSRNVAQRPVDLATSSPLSQTTTQSPSQPQLLRRRSLKSDKPLMLPELKLTSSHGSTSSSQQVISSINNELLPDLPKPNAPFAAKTGLGSPMRNGFSSFPGRNIRPSPSQKALPRSPQPAAMGNKPSKEPLDGFSQYAQEIENNSKLNDTTKAPQYSPAKMSPELRRPPTPEYSKHDAPSSQTDLVSPASPMTPPEEPRALSAIGEDVSQAASPAAVAPSTTSLPKTSPRPAGLPSAPNGNKMGLPRSPRINGGSPAGIQPIAASSTGGASLLRPSPTIQPGPASPHARSISDTSVPTIEISDDGASTIKASSPHRPATAASSRAATGWQQQPLPQSRTTTTSEEGSHQSSDLVKAAPGELNYFPMVHYKLPSIAPGTVLAPPPLRQNQLDCFASHYRFTSSRNEDHPLACQSCHIKDRGMRFTCAHCAVRICSDCRDVLMMNGRDLNKLVEMLKA